MSSLSLSLAFLAGLLSILSPCVLSLVPVYLGYLTGTTAQLGEEKHTWHVFSHALVFVLGFTAIFVLVIGLPMTFLGAWIQRHGIWLSRIAGGILILFALHILGVVDIPFLNMSRSSNLGKSSRIGYGRSLLMGAAFASGWSPCVGPLLALVISLAATEPAKAMLYLLVYAVGMAIPFLISALLLTRVTGWIRRIAKHGRWFEWITGGLMLLIGLLLITGLFESLNMALLRLTPDWLIQHM